MLTLGIDSSSAALSAAVVEAGQDPWRPVAALTADGRRPAEHLAPLVREVLAAAGVAARDLDAVAVGVGPGPFTALRAGLVTARTLGHALGVPVHGAGSLDALAAEALAAGAPGELVVATDARRREVYWARYSGGRRVAGPAVGQPADVVETLTRRDPAAAGPVPLPAVAGRGALRYPEPFAVLDGPDPTWPAEPSAAWVACLATSGAAAGAALPSEVAGLGGGVPPEPQYLRRPDAREPGPRKRVTPAGAGRP